MNDNQIETINTQLAFSAALIFASSLNLYITFMYKDILINKNSSKYNEALIYKLALLSANIFLIVTIYFLITSYEDFESNKSIPSYNYYMASILSFTAQSIRINTLIKYPETILGIQDII